MYRMGWSLLSPRQALTRLPSRTLSNHYYYGYPSCREEDRPYHQYGNVTCTDDQWDRLCAWLTGDPTFRSKIEHHKKELKEKIVGKRDDFGNRTKARRIAPPLGVSSSSSAARPYYRNRPPPPPPPRGWWQQKKLRDSYHWQLDFPTVLISPMKVVALAIVVLRC